MDPEAAVMLPLAFSLSWLLTAVVRRYALAHDVLDHPDFGLGLASQCFAPPQRRSSARPASSSVT